MDTRILDISHVDLAMGRVLEQGPVLVITFTSQQVRASAIGISFFFKYPEHSNRISNDYYNEMIISLN